MDALSYQISQFCTLNSLDSFFLIPCLTIWKFFITEDQDQGKLLSIAQKSSIEGWAIVAAIAPSLLSPGITSEVLIYSAILSLFVIKGASLLSLEAFNLLSETLSPSLVVTVLLLFVLIRDET